ncbi:flippase-like domain-containing protein [Halosquirtibacter laminarini]|uniref:Flippase-like domain-containing protein n=1 Tax=Halosquirtibacter laminarini TaxID=3374600 RepID=A0AC61NQW1_9BACT|nr:flippase-like domain-containing protein [Prolixibacteraceae bacterium]
MNKKTDALKNFHPIRIILPILIGLMVAFYLFYNERDQIEDFSFSSEGKWFILGACALMLTRDIGYIIRLHILSNQKLTWLQCTKIVFLWEFASAITPTAIGGTGVAVFFLHHEKMSWAESTTVVMATSFLDELFFAISFPILLITIGGENLFVQYEESTFVNNLIWFAIAGYSIKLLYILFVSYSLFFNPKLFKKLIVSIASLPFINKWKKAAIQYGDEFITASYSLQKRSLSYWIGSFLSTALSWISRYWTANLIILGVTISSTLPSQDIFQMSNQLIIFARQLIMWIMMMVMPSPGGAGFSEFLFSRYMVEFIPAGLENMVALIWRSVSYYPYLLIGSILFPIWLRRSFKKRKK